MIVAEYLRRNKEFSLRFKNLAFSKRLKFIGPFFLEIIWLCLPVMVISSIIVFAVVFVSTGFGYKFPVILVVSIVGLGSIMVGILIIFKKFPTEKLLKKLEDFERY